MEVGGRVRLSAAALLLGCTSNQPDSPPSQGSPPEDRTNGICPATSEEQPTRLTTKSGVLVGTLRLPSGCAPYPVVLIIAGSGPTDRDGNDLPAFETSCSFQNNSTSAS